MNNLQEQINFSVEIINEEKHPVIKHFEEALKAANKIASLVFEVTDKESKKAAKEIAARCNTISQNLQKARLTVTRAYGNELEEQSKTLEKIFEAKGKEINSLIKAYDESLKEPEPPKPTLFKLEVSSYNKEKLQAIKDYVSKLNDTEIAISDNLGGKE